MASTLKVTMADQLTLVGMLQKIAEGSEAGTYGKAFISRLLTAGEKMKAFNGGKPLKLVDEKGQAKPLIEVLEIFKDAMQAAKQAGKADVFMKGLKEAFEDEGLKALLFLIENTEGYARAQAELNKAMNKGVAVSHQMAAAQDDHLNAQKNLLMQTVEVVADALGKLFTPEIMQGLKDMRAWVNDTLAPWIQKNPELAKGITQVSLALGGLLVAVGLATKAFGALGLAVWANPLTWKIMAIAALVGSVVYVVYEFYNDWRAAWDRWGDYVISIVAGLGFVFNPIVGTAIAVVGYIINHWSELGAFFDSLWAEIQDRGQRVWWVIQGMGQMVLDDLQEAWSGFVDFFSGLWAEIQDRGQQVWAGIQEAGQGAFNGIKAVWSGVAEDFSSLWAEIQDRGQKVWAGIQEAGQGAFNGIKAAWSGVAGDFSNLWTQIQERAQKVWEGTPGADQLGLDGITAAWSGLSGHLGGLWTGIQDRAQRSWWVIQGAGQMVLDELKAAWSGFAGFFSGLWGGIQNRAQRAWWVIQGAGQMVLIEIETAWSGFAGFFSGLWDGIQNRAQRAWWVIQGAGQMAMDYLTGKWAEFKQWLDGLMAGLQEAGNRLWDGISETLEAFIKRAREKWDNLGKLIRNLPDSLREAWDAFWTWLGQKADSVLGPLGSALRGIGDFFGFGDDEKPKAAPKPKPQSGFKQILKKNETLSRRESQALQRLKTGNRIMIPEAAKSPGRASSQPLPAAQPTEGKLEVIIKAPKGSAQISNLEKRGGDGWNILAGIEELWAGI